jgi:hypothetical protein
MRGTQKPACPRREGRRRPVLLGGPLPGTEVALVVDVHAVGNGIKSPLAAEFLHDGEQFILAVKTAGSVVAGVFRAIEFAGHHDLQRDSLLAGEGGGSGQLGSGQTGRIGDHGQHVAAQYFMRRPG